MSEQSPPRAVGFQITVHQEHGHAVVELAGELDMAGAPRLWATLSELSARGVHHTVIDLHRLQFIDSTGLSVLAMNLKSATAANGSMTLYRPPERIVKLFQITGLTDVFRIVVDE